MTWDRVPWRQDRRQPRSLRVRNSTGRVNECVISYSCESGLKLKPRFLDPSDVRITGSPTPPQASNTSPQLPLSVLLGEFQGLCVSGRAVWSCLDPALVPCLQVSPVVAAGLQRPEVRHAVQGRKGSSPVFAPSEALRPDPIWPAWGREGGAHSGPLGWTEGPHRHGRGLGWAAGSCPFTFPPLLLTLRTLMLPRLWAWFCTLPGGPLEQPSHQLWPGPHSSHPPSASVWLS